MTTSDPIIRNKQTISVKDIPLFDEDAFARGAVGTACRRSTAYAPISATGRSGETHLYAVCADDLNGLLYVLSGTTRAGDFPP